MPQKVWNLQKDALRQIGRCASDHGVLACLENMISFKEFLCRLPEELIGMTEGIEGIGMTFDFGHANTIGKVSEFLRYVEKANHIHIHDNHGMSDEHLPLGEGTIAWETVGMAVASRYNGGRVVIEGRSVEEAKKSLALFRKCIRMSGETLQVYFLGTAGALPTPTRNPPCIMIRRGSDTLLFDCGEGAQQQMMRARCGFTINCDLCLPLACRPFSRHIRPRPDHVIQRPHGTPDDLWPGMGA